MMRSRWSPKLHLLFFLNDSIQEEHNAFVFIWFLIKSIYPQYAALSTDLALIAAHSINTFKCPPIKGAHIQYSNKMTSSDANSRAELIFHHPRYLNGYFLKAGTRKQIKHVLIFTAQPLRWPLWSGEREQEVSALMQWYFVSLNLLRVSMATAEAMWQQQLARWSLLQSKLHHTISLL